MIATYDASTHTTTDEHGLDVPHVTTVLGAVGLTTDFDELSRESRRMAGILEQARARGTAVHADCHAFDDDDLDLADVDPRVRPYVEAWARFRGDKGLIALAHARERHVVHPVFRYAGILDGIFKQILGKRRILVDIKTGDPEDAAAHLQTAAYQGAWELQHPDELVDERWAVWLQPGLRVPYRVVNYSARAEAFEDFQVFLAALTTYHNQPQRRRRIA